MSRIREELLRGVNGDDVIKDVPALSWEELSLELKDTKVFTKTDAPYYNFDILVGEEKRVGSIQFVMEPNEETVKDQGHI